MLQRSWVARFLRRQIKCRAAGVRIPSGSRLGVLPGAGRRLPTEHEPARQPAVKIALTNQP